MPDDDTFLDWFRSAAPYFSAHRNRRIVVQFDGDVVAGEDFADFVHDIALLNSLSVELILVPATRSQIESRLETLGRDAPIAGAHRVTDAQLLSVVRDAAADVVMELQAKLSMGLVNSPMHRARIRVGTGNFITARPYGVRDGIDFGYTGEVRRVDTAAIESQLAMGAVVVVPPIGFSPTGDMFNLLAEEVATAVAVEIRAHKLVLMGAGATLLDQGGERISDLSLADAIAHHARLRSAGGGDPQRLHRFEAALHACRNGVKRVHLVDSRHRGALPLELYTRDGLGTMINADSYDAVRRATIEDVGGLLELIEPLERSGVLVRRSRPDIECTIGQYFVEERDGAIVACAAAHPFDEERVVELACLAVRADYRHTGRGEALLELVERDTRSRGADKLFVLTTQASHWFRERGFEDASIDSLPVARRALYNYQRASKVLVKAL